MVEEVWNGEILTLLESPLAPVNDLNRALLNPRA